MSLNYGSISQSARSLPLLLVAGALIVSGLSLAVSEEVTLSLLTLGMAGFFSSFS